MTWKITKTDLLKNGRLVAFFTEDSGEFTLHGFFGEVYGCGKSRMEAAKIAIKDRRLSKVPAGAAR